MPAAERDFCPAANPATPAPGQAFRLNFVNLGHAWKATAWAPPEGLALAALALTTYDVAGAATTVCLEDL